MANKKAGGKGQRKYGRSGRKQARKGSPISLFVRGKISGEEYFKQSNQTRKV
jgi:hypothetical protein